ncbi:MAG: hypothetical protein FWD39_06145, partial [Clostridiales bacterium]|nr:hypothetical protein [Clostridiales bacterium]
EVEVLAVLITPEKETLSPFLGRGAVGGERLPGCSWMIGNKAAHDCAGGKAVPPMIGKHNISLKGSVQTWIDTSYTLWEFCHLLSQ